MKPISIALTLVLSMVLLLCNCQNGTEIVSDLHKPDKVMLSINVSPYQQIAFENAPSSRSTDLSSLCKTLMLAIYKGEKLDTLVTQQNGDASFGSLSLDLSRDTYRFVVLAHSSAKQPNMKNPKLIDFGSRNMSDVLSWSNLIHIDKDTVVDVKLSRVVAKVEIVSTDSLLPKDAGFYATYSGGCSNILDATTGRAPRQIDDYQMLTFSNDEKGKPLNVSFYTFPAANDTIKELYFYTNDKKGNIIDSKTINNVPIKANFITRLTGRLHK